MVYVDTFLVYKNPCSSYKHSKTHVLAKLRNAQDAINLFPSKFETPT